MERLGEQIQELRRQRDLTLRALSRQSGFSVSFLSQVERGLSSLSISSLRAVADALGVDLSYFFPPPVHTNYVTRTTDRKPFRLQGSSIAYVSLGGSFPARTLEPLLVTIPPRHRVSEPFAHPGEEFVYVLKGRSRSGSGGSGTRSGPAMGFISARACATRSRTRAAIQ